MVKSIVCGQKDYNKLGCSYFLKFLGEDFLVDYLDRWEAQVGAIIGLKQEEKNRLLLSHQTQHGWRLTGRSSYFILFIVSMMWLQTPT